MRHCFYHTDLRQNTAFHNFSSQIALIQYSEPSKHAWAYLALAIWPVTGRGFNNNKWPAVLYSQ